MKYLLYICLILNFIACDKDKKKKPKVTNQEISIAKCLESKLKLYKSPVKSKSDFFNRLNSGFEKCLVHDRFAAVKYMSYIFQDAEQFNKIWMNKGEQK